MPSSDPPADALDVADRFVPELGSLPEFDAWMAEREAELSALIVAEMGRLVTGALDVYASTLTASGDVAALDDAALVWRSFVTETVGEYVAGMYFAGNMAAWLSVPGSVGLDPDIAATWANVVNQQAVAYQTTATNRIVGASMDMWQDVRERTVVALRDGMSNEALKDQIESITGYSEFRADTIGRTEVIAAYNGGDMAGARALGDAGPQSKEWLATGDARTREEHAVADGQVVPLGEKFNVGGELLDHPGDPGGSPGNVVNCRCVVLFHYDDDDVPE